MVEVTSVEAESGGVDAFRPEILHCVQNDEGVALDIDGWERLRLRMTVIQGNYNDYMHIYRIKSKKILLNFEQNQDNLRHYI